MIKLKKLLEAKDDFWSSRIDAQKLKNDIIEKFGEKKFNSMYDNISPATVLAAAKKAKWYLKDQAASKFEDSNSVVAGVTDYTNHMNDSLETLKSKVIDSLKNDRQQSLNFYNTDGKIFDTIIIRPERGGWVAKVYWSDGKPGFKEIARKIR
jgi:hypothetical protein